MLWVLCVGVLCTIYAGKCVSGKCKLTDESDEAEPQESGTPTKEGLSASDEQNTPEPQDVHSEKSDEKSDGEQNEAAMEVE